MFAKAVAVKLAAHEDISHAFEDEDFRANGLVNVRNAQGVGATRILHNNHHVRRELLAAREVAEQRRKRSGRVEAANAEAGGVIDVTVTSTGLFLPKVVRQPIMAQAMQRRHEKARVVVFIVGAEPGLLFLVGGIDSIASAWLEP